MGESRKKSKITMFNVKGIMLKNLLFAIKRRKSADMKKLMKSESL